MNSQWLKAWTVAFGLGTACFAWGCETSADGDPTSDTPCAEETCSDHGTCVLVNDQPACVCDEGSQFTRPVTRRIEVYPFGGRLGSMFFTVRVLRQGVWGLW